MIEKFFGNLAAFSVRRPWLVLLLTLAGLAASIGSLATRLEMRTSNLDLIDPSLPEVSKFLDFAREFGTPNVLVVTLEGADVPALEQAVGRLGPRLRELPGVRAVMDRIPYDTAVLGELGIDPFLASKDRNMFMIFVQPLDARSSADTIAPLVESVRGLLADPAFDQAGIRTGMTGIPVYAIDDRDVIQRDMSKLSFLSLGLIAALFVASFRSIRRPLLAVLALLAGVVLTAGFITIYPGHLTLLSAFFASTLFGLGIDYGIHIINRVEEGIVEGHSERDAIPAAVRSLARELLTAAVTTAAGFYAMAWSGFRGFEELGIIAGTGVLICLLVMCSFLPALLALVPGNWKGLRRFEHRRTSRVILSLQHRGLALALLALIVAGLAAGNPGFDSDYLNLEPAGSEAVRLERAIATNTDFSTQFAVFVADSRERAETIANQAMDNEAVSEVRSFLDIEMLTDAAAGHEPPPAYFRQGFISTSGQYAVYAYPRGNVWDPAAQANFNREMRKIDPGATGMPFLGAFMVARSQRALYLISGLGLLLMFISVWLDFRRLGLALLASAPVLLTLLALRGLMKVFGIPLNPLNVMALPIVIGISVDNGVYLLHRFRKERGDLVKTLAGTGRSIMMTSLTTMAGFGALIFTAHRGMASFASALTLGVGASLLISLFIMPQLLRLTNAGGRAPERGA